MGKLIYNWPVRGAGHHLGLASEVGAVSWTEPSPRGSQRCLQVVSVRPGLNYGAPSCCLPENRSHLVSAAPGRVGSVGAELRTGCVQSSQQVTMKTPSQRVTDTPKERQADLESGGTGGHVVLQWTEL